jgi:hypothetical protein
MASFLHVSPLHISLLPHTCHMPHPSHSSLCSRSNNIRGGTRVTNLCRMHPTLNPLLLPHPLATNITLSTPLSNILSPCSSFCVRSRVSHPYKTYIQRGARNAIPFYNPIKIVTSQYRCCKRASECCSSWKMRQMA